MENHITLLEIEAKTRRRRERGATAARTKAMGLSLFLNLLYFSDLMEWGGGRSHRDVGHNDGPDEPLPGTRRHPFMSNGIKDYGCKCYSKSILAAI